MQEVPGRCLGAGGDHQLVASNGFKDAPHCRVFLPRSEETPFHKVKCGASVLKGEAACKSDPPHMLTSGWTRCLLTDLAPGWRG